MNEISSYDPDCRLCPRLSSFLDEVKQEHADYFCRPVPAFGAPDPGLLIVGLAPGKHGANRSGRPFTGDHAGLLLYETLYKAGFAGAPVSRDPNDGLELLNCRITNAVKCLPPENKPSTREIRECNPYLAAEIDSLDDTAIILALGKIAHDAVLRSQQLALSRFKFEHGKHHRLPDGRILIDSYHCSRYNTQTGRLTASMFESVFDEIRSLVSAR